MLFLVQGGKWTFRNNIVVAAYPIFVYVVSRAGRQVDIRKVHILTRDFS